MAAKAWNWTPQAMPTAIAAKTKTRSRASFSGVRKRTIDMAPTSAKARAMSEPMITMMRDTVTPTRTMAWRNVLE